MITETRVTQISCDGINKEKKAPCTKGLVIEKPLQEAILEAMRQGWTIEPRLREIASRTFCPQHKP